jgi:hypothetical protein
MATSVVTTFLDAFKKALGRKPDVDTKELARSSGGTLGSTPDGHAFDPLRPAPEPDAGTEVTTGTVSVASADPEEGGESR